MANILLKPKNRKERDAKEALRVISEKTEGTFRKSFDVGFARNSTIHKGRRKKAVPAKPKKRRKFDTRWTDDGREIIRSTYAWLKRRKEIWERDGKRCVLCPRVLELDEAEIDHIRKRSLGRDDRPSNLRTLCPPCHRKRHNQ